MATHLQFILDKSGSMGPLQADTIGGYNRYLADRQAEADLDYRFSLTLFDTEVTHPYTERTIAQVPPLTAREYVPGGNTALFDAVASGVTRISGYAQSGEKVLVVVLTDGQENSSRETTLAQLQELIAAKRALGWEFAFLSTDMALWQSAALGVAAVASAAFAPTPAGMAANFMAASASTADYVRGRTPGYVDVRNRKPRP